MTFEQNSCFASGLRSEIRNDRKRRSKNCAVNAREHGHAPGRPAVSGGPAVKTTNTSGGHNRTASGDRASPEANPKGCGRDEDTDENGRITKQSPALEKHVEGDILISLLSIKAKL